MPFIDLNTQPSIEQFSLPDFIVIGAGAAGILLAVELTKKGKTVTLIESGNFYVDEERQSLNEVINSGKELDSALTGRFRAIGGSTLRWGGGSSAFSEHDFQKRSWVQNSGWPIAYEEVSKYYPGVNKFMKIDERLNSLIGDNPGFDNEKIDYKICKWAPEPNFQKIYKDYLKKHVNVIYNAVLLSLNCNQNAEIEEITISNFISKRFTLRSTCIILAAGGIECNRILLANTSLANADNNYLDSVGKMFMEHPSICAGIVRTGNVWRLQRIFNTHFFKKAKYSIRLNLNKKFQEENHVLNCTASIMSVNEGDDDPYAELKNFKNNFSVKGLMTISKFLPSLVQSVYALIFHSFIYKPGDESKLFLMAEQEPVDDSYIRLSNEKDAFGIPKAEVHWTVSQQSWKTIVFTSLLLKKEIERLGLAEVILDKEIYLDNPGWEDKVTNVNHHMGGIRMSKTMNEGVVDTNLKVWGIKNLYVCSSAVFPTGSHSNPTVTMLALGLRLVDYLTGPVKK